MKGVCDGHGMFRQDIVVLIKYKEWKLCENCKKIAKEINI